MSEPKFTPGPWLPHMAFNDSEGFPEFCVDLMKPATREDYKLIAAAPELYGVLEYVRDVLGPHNGWADDSKRMIDATLAKARGE